ncbi:MAG: hypothetical protein ACOCX3_02355 [Chloroflexota bacterium]
MGFIFFILFGAALLATYIAIRRELASPGLIAAGGMLASIVTMMLYLFSRNAAPVQGIIFGVVIGVIFAGATIGIAWYFHHQERVAASGGELEEHAP